VQLLGYVVRLWERERRRVKRPPLPAVIPMVLYQGEDEGAVPPFEGLVDYSAAGAYRVDFPYGRCLLGRDRLERLEDNPQLEIALHVLKYGRDEALPAHLETILSRFRRLDLGQREGRGYLSVVLRYLVQVGRQLEEPLLRAALNRALPAAVGESMMATLAETWMQQGFERGYKWGFERGYKQGLLAHERGLILRFASSKFGSAAGQRLSILLDRIEDPESLDAVVDWIIECDRAEEFLARIGNVEPSSDRFFGQAGQSAVKFVRTDGPIKLSRQENRFPGR